MLLLGWTKTGDEDDPSCVGLGEIFSFSHRFFVVIFLIDRNTGGVIANVTEQCLLCLLLYVIHRI